MERKKVKKKKKLAPNMWPNEEISGWDELIWEITGTYSTILISTKMLFKKVPI